MLSEFFYVIIFWFKKLAFNNDNPVMIDFISKYNQQSGITSLGLSGSRAINVSIYWQWYIMGNIIYDLIFQSVN